MYICKWKKELKKKRFYGIYIEIKQMEIPFVNQSALRESARYQNDTRRRSFPFRDVLILYIVKGVAGRLPVFMWTLNVSIAPSSNLRQKFMNL